MKALALTLLVGCSTSPADKPAPAQKPAAVPATPVRTSGLAENPLAKRSIWRGHYLCRQGETKLQLTIEPSDGGVTATFEFSEWPTNPGVPSGSYRMTGHLDELANGVSLTLVPDRWLVHPKGYGMVGLNATSDASRTHLRGTIDTDGCAEVHLTLVE